MSEKHEFAKEIAHNDMDIIVAENDISLVAAIANTDPLQLVVGIGASAGGLEALKTFFGGMQADTGMAFVLVQHLAPHASSALATLIAGHTAMQVKVATDGTQVEANTVYVIPPDAMLTIASGRLHVASPALQPDRRLSVATFFTSLAIDQGHNAVGIILSGFGSDGMEGIAAIKEHGGLTLSQAEFDRHAKSGMPQTANAARVVDHVVPVEEMPAALLNYQHHRSILGASIDGKDVNRNLLVTETRFFRDPAAFAALADKVLATLFSATSTNEPVRIWVAACASGEEAYSIAILLLELIESTGHCRPIQIFATDIDDRAISVARAGRYPASIADVVSPERLDRHFTKEHEFYHVSKAVRKICLFSAHDLIKDPPFSRLDVITCRNLLADLQPALQEHVLAIFHYALRQDGNLMLGQSELVPSHSGLFATLDKRNRIYVRRNVAARFPTFLLAPSHLQTPTSPAHEASDRKSATTARPLTPPDSAHPAAKPPSGAEFEKQLLLAQQRLRALSEELEAANEELQSSNQEYLAVNEELQSANEELETSKEELQSLNEELQSTNTALNQRNDSLVRSSGDLNNLFDSTSIATLFLDSALNIRRFTPQLLDIFNLRAGDEGRPISDIVTRLTVSSLTQFSLAEDVLQVLSTRKSVEREVTAMSGVTYLMQIRPYRELSNAVNGAVVTFVDISERKLHETARSRLAAIVESSQDGIISHDLSDIITSWNAGAQQLFGFTAAEAIGQVMSNLLRGPQPEDWPNHRITAADKPPVERFETTLITKAGHALDVSITKSPVRDGDGRIVGASVVARDNSERKATDRKAELLLGELDHRVKNILAVVSAVVSQTLSSGLTPETFAEEVQGRIRAVAKAHSLLTHAGHGTLSLRDVIETELAPYGRNSGQIVVQGPDLDMTPKAGLALAMAIHELTSNAAKYGALSNHQGHLTVISSLSSGPEGMVFALDWTEANGPPVVPPTRRGFGTSLIERALAYELDAKVTRSFAATGVVCQFLIPLTEEVGHVQPCPVD